MLAVVLASGAGCATKGPDRYESVNRKVFAFNEALDIYAIGPAARAWKFVTPQFVRTGVENFFVNLHTPQYVFNNLLQGDVDEAGASLMRGAFNLIFGLAGFVDAATWAEFPEYRTDFGLTLGHWGVGTGAFVMLPIFGPSNPRDTTGLVVDALTNPISYFVPIYVSVSGRALELGNLRAKYDAEITQNRDEAFDYYVFLRTAYQQNRQFELTGEKPPEEQPANQDELYYFDDEDENE